MIVYEVNLEFDVAIAAAYRAWLSTHIQQILEFHRGNWTSVG